MTQETDLEMIRRMYDHGEDLNKVYYEEIVQIEEEVKN